MNLFKKYWFYIGLFIIVLGFLGPTYRDMAFSSGILMMFTGVGFITFRFFVDKQREVKENE